MSVNFSDKPVVLVNDFELNDAVRRNIKTVSNYLDEIYGSIISSYESINTGPIMKRYTFKKFFVFSKNSGKRFYGTSWVMAAYEYVLLGDLRASENLVVQLLGEDSVDYLPATKVSLRRALWLLLILLFKDKCLLLTPLLKANQYKNNSPVLLEFGFDHYPELMAFTISARDKVDLPVFWQGVDQRVRERIAQYGARLFWIIGAVKPEDLTIESLVAVHQKYFYEKERLTAELPVHTIAHYVCSFFGERVNFSYDELFHALNALRPMKYKSGSKGELTAINFVPIIDQSESDDQLVDYCRLLVRNQFMPARVKQNPILSHSSFHNTPALMRWMAVQKAYLELKAYEDENHSAFGLSYLNIYLFVYLDKWFSLFGCCEGFSYPEYISQLDLKFVAPIAKHSGAPLPLKDFIESMAKDSPTVKSASLQQLRVMFEWMEAKKFEDEEGKFKNHLLKIDMPEGSGLPNSDKRPFKRAEYSLAINYLYCVFLALEILNDDIFKQNYADIMHGSLEERALSLGWKNEFYYSGRKYVVEALPQCFFKRWSIPLAGEGSKTIFSPHLIVHVISAVESGLRHQSIQWLSTDFDKYVVGEVELNKAYWLHVVVDKVKKRPIRTIVSGQTIVVLRYQRKIRELVSSPVFNRLKSYENRHENVREDYFPLFSKSVSSGDPYTDSVYSEGYLSFLVEFQFFLKRHGVVSKFYEFKPNGFSYGQIVIPNNVVVLSVNFPYCPVRVVTDMTPHHTRNSTVKVWQRIMKDSEVGKFKTGQGVRTVRYYGTLIDEDFNEVTEKINNDIVRIWKGERLDASHPTSNFRKALNVDASQALRDFNCITMSHISVLQDNSALKDLTEKYDGRVSHHSTHICTKGDACTQEIIDEGLEKRCGLCIFSVKGVDNIPAIDVKIYNLSMEVEELHSYADSISEENVFELEQVDVRLERTVSDLLGWTWSRDYLVECYRRDVASSNKLISIQPQLMKKSMREVEMNDSSMQYIFSRLYENSLYPELQAEVVRARYNFLKMRLRGGSVDIAEIFKPAISDPAALLVTQVKSMLQVNNITIDEFTKRLEIGQSVALDDYIPLILTSLGEDDVE
ncbi:hypothetical protein [Pseudomonas sp. GM55]|uniref:hypothetical protein n=1 Tax=Pseudomonas sp. GM55 TaxID=1144333 RepID=UPI000270A6B8|nr:hypothetical protein [Pseudomonas sp. GM55]EJM78902.1 hypothetical protein PMI31_00227 [Pseudomonas sp. GM55]